MTTGRRRAHGVSHRIAPVFVTGAGAGIGAAVTRRLARAGRPTLISDIDPRSAELASESGAFYCFDVADRDGWARTALDVQSRFGMLSGLVLNVGGGTGEQPVDVLSISDAALDRAVAVNCGGVLNGLRALGSLLGGEHPAHVVVMASVRGIWPGPLDPVYSMTKHALVGLVRSSAPSLMARNIRINVVCPGPTLTPATETFVAAQDYRGAPWQPADAVAKAVMSLLDTPSTGGAYLVLDSVVTKLRLPRPRY